MSNPVFKPTSWRFVTSEGSEFGVGLGKTGVATTKMSFYVADANDPDELMHELLFVGLGAGVGIGLPVSGSFSKAEWPSEGYRIFRGPTGPGTLTADDFNGPAFVISANAGLGWFGKDHGYTPGGLLVYFGATGRKACGMLVGLSVSTPGIGATLYSGWVNVDP